MKIRRLFEKRDWTINSSGNMTISSTINCHGNFFQMVHALFGITLKK